MGPCHSTGTVHGGRVWRPRLRSRLCCRPRRLEVPPWPLRRRLIAQPPHCWPPRPSHFPESSLESRGAVCASSCYSQSLWLTRRPGSSVRFCGARRPFGRGSAGHPLRGGASLRWSLGAPRIAVSKRRSRRAVFLLGRTGPLSPSMHSRHCGALASDRSGPSFR